jgi:hypothetical protein
MSPDISMLITFLYCNSSLLVCGFKCDRNLLPSNFNETYNEEDSKNALISILPEHFRELGPIVRIDLEVLFDIYVKES